MRTLIPTLRKVASSVADINFDEIRDKFRILDGIAFLNGALHTDVATVASGSNIELDHKLGRPYRGFICFDGLNLEVDPANTEPEKQIWLRVTGTALNSTVTIWVY